MKKFAVIGNPINHSLSPQIHSEFARQHSIDLTYEKIMADDDISFTSTIENLINKLKIKKNSKVLDLACGRGRHSIFLNKKGMIVSGFDSSENNILEAKKNNTKNLKFFKKEMDKSYNDSFDIIFNLFTSFGYIDHNHNSKVFQRISESLNINGLLVLDFLNILHVKKNIVKEEIKKVDNITFNLKRFIKNQILYKKIDFTYNKNEYSFKESVMCLELKNFKDYLKDLPLEIIEVFGNYNLENFHPDSERLIMVIKKSQP